MLGKWNECVECEATQKRGPEKRRSSVRIYLPIMYAGGNPLFAPFNIAAGPPAVIVPLYTGPFHPLLFPGNEFAVYCVAVPFIGLIAPAYPILFGASPGGAARPGGGPLAVLNDAPGPPIIVPFIPCIDTFDGPGEVIPCPDRTPRGFLEKLSLMPPLMLLCRGCPYSSWRAFVAKETSSNSTKQWKRHWDVPIKHYRDAKFCGQEWTITCDGDVRFR